LTDEARSLLKEKTLQFTKTIVDKDERQKVKLEIIKLIDSFDKAKTDNGKLKTLKSLSSIFITKEIEEQKKKEVVKKAVEKKQIKEEKKEVINKKKALDFLVKSDEKLSDKEVEELEKLLAKSKKIENKNVPVSSTKRSGEY
jgi:hypothetical protein